MKAEIITTSPEGIVAFINPHKPLTPDFFQLIKGYESLYDTGWGNGYIAIPKSINSFWFGDTYDYIPIEVHGGLSYSRSSNEHDFGLPWTEEHWLIGFDTAHYGDNPTNQPKEYIIQETLKMLKDFQEINNSKKHFIYNAGDIDGN